MQTALFGREPELAVLADGLQNAMGGRSGLVLCEGDPGIGKTRLAAELADVARARGVLVAWGNGSDTPGAPPYWPWRQILRTLATQLDLCALAGEHRLVPDLARLAPDVFDGDERSVDRDAAVEERFRQFDAIGRLLRMLSRREPLLIVLDDLQWADQASVLALQHVVETVREDHLFVMANTRSAPTRPGRAVSDLLHAPVVRRMQLAGLSSAAVGQQLSAVLGREVNDGEAAQVHAVTGGNPLYVAEVVRSARYGTLSTAGASLRDAIGARLRRLNPDCVQVLEAASIVGMRFGVEVLADIVGRPALSCLATLDVAVAAGLVEAAAAGEFRFSHAVVRDAIEAGLSSGKRVELHCRAAAAIEKCYRGRLGPRLFDLARHWTVAAVAGERRGAADWVHRAANEAMRQLAFEDAARFFAQALDIGAGTLDAADRCQLLVSLGAARQLSGDIAGGVEACRQAAQLAGELSRADLSAEAALALEPSFVPELNLALRQLCETALAALDDDQVVLRARVTARFAETCHFLGDIEPARPASEGLVATAEKTGDPVALVAALQARQLVRSGPDGLAERTTLADRMLALGRDTADTRAQLWGHLWRIDAAVERGDLAAVAQELDATAWCAQQVGGPLASWQLARARAMLAQAQARFADARRHEAKAFAAWAPIEGPAATVVRAALTSAAAHHSGHTTDSLRASGLDEPFVPGPDILASGVVGAVASAWVLTDVGRLDEAASIYRLLGPAEGWRPFPHCALLGYAFGVAVAGALADRLDVTADLATLRARLEPYRGHHVVSGAGCIGYLGPVEFWLGLAAAHQHELDRAVDDIEQAVAISCRCGTPGFETEARYELAAVLARRRRGGDRTQARDLAAEAVTRAEALGMSPIAARARRLLDRIDPARSALTHRECEVAELVALGLTNREIATRLYLSERTAQTHVQHILTKLDLANRSQITAWVLSRKLRMAAP